MVAAPRPTTTAAPAFVRHSRFDPCPVCAGYAGLPAGQERRCAGMTGDFIIWCTREERAGKCELDINTSPPAYKHYRFGPCPCGNVPVVTTTLPVRWTWTLALSQSPAPQPSPGSPIHFDGATPQTSM